MKQKIPANKHFLRYTVRMNNTTKKVTTKSPAKATTDPRIPALTSAYAELLVLRAEADSAGSQGGNHPAGEQGARRTPDARLRR